MAVWKLVWREMGVKKPKVSKKICQWIVYKFNVIFENKKTQSNAKVPSQS